MKEKLKNLFFEEVEEIDLKKINDKIYIGDCVYEKKQELSEEDINEIEKRKIEYKNEVAKTSIKRKYSLLISAVLMLIVLLGTFRFTTPVVQNNIFLNFIMMGDDWLTISVSDFILLILLIDCFLDYKDFKNWLKEDIIAIKKYIYIESIIFLVLSIFILTTYLYFIGYYNQTIISESFFIKLFFVIFSLYINIRYISLMYKNIKRLSKINEGLV